MPSVGQSVLAGLWWGPLRRPFEAVVRRALARRQRVLAGPLRGLRFEGGLAQRLGIYELPVQEVFRRLLRPGDVVWDVGGHHGYLALLAARRVGPRGRVFVFEPVEESRRVAARAVAVNGLASVEIVPRAVGEREGEAELWVGRESPVASLRPVAGGEARRVRQTTLDAFAAGHPAPTLLKIDVEGAEAEVLAGGRELLAEAAPRVLVEVHGGECERDVRRILAGHGYRLSVLEARSSRHRPYPRHLLAEPQESQVRETVR